MQFPCELLHFIGCFDCDDECNARDDESEGCDDCGDQRFFSHTRTSLNGQRTTMALVDQPLVSPSARVVPSLFKLILRMMRGTYGDLTGG